VYFGDSIFVVIWTEITIGKLNSVGHEIHRFQCRNGEFVGKIVKNIRPWSLEVNVFRWATQSEGKRGPRGSMYVEISLLPRVDRRTVTRPSPSASKIAGSGRMRQRD
jgi:hypothetical protein